ncbi:hypothetical protein HKX48_006922 [Thoreauomyces humboldtii]|nr:hypothetical protein HKX48_006922 [Thoreauomyces humboldtii]
MPLPLGLEPYAGFPDLEAKLLPFENPRTYRKNPNEHSAHDARRRAWDWEHLDADARFPDVVTRFLRNPCPRPRFERWFGVHLLQIIDTSFIYQDAFDPSPDRDRRFWDPVNSYDWGDEAHEERLMVPTERFIDFDLTNGGSVHRLRMALSLGEPEAEIGRAFSVRDRDDANRVVAWSYGVDDQHSIECVDRGFADAWVEVPAVASVLERRVVAELDAYGRRISKVHPPLTEEERDDDEDPVSCFERIYPALKDLVSGHQCELVFAFVGTLTPSDFGTPGDVPHRFGRLLNVLLLRTALGALLHEDVIQLVADWLDPAVLHWEHMEDPTI